MSSLTSSTPSESATSSLNNAPTSNPGNNQPATQSSSLYLFTFLATLLLLLAVSCAIVIRSFILRRRFRRRIEEALAAGVLIPGALEDGPGGIGRGRRRDFGEKPKLWEVWVDEHEQVHDSSYEGGLDADNLGKGEGRWEGILPVSATLMSSNNPKSLSLPGDGSTTSFSTSERQRTHRLFISRLLSQRPFTTPSPPLPHVPSGERNESEAELNSEAIYPAGGAKDRPKEEERLQVSVLISMPNPNSRRTYGSDTGSDISVKGKGKRPGLDDSDGDAEPDIPDVVFGVAEVNFRP